MSSICWCPLAETQRARLYLTVSPGARHNELLGIVDGRLRVRIAALAQEGKANKALVAFLACCLGVPPTYVTLATGARSRHKVVEIQGLTAEEAIRRLEKYPG